MGTLELRTVARDGWRRVDGACRLATASMRALPDFLIIGEAKCGTTSLYDDLVQHPLVLEAAVKEVHFFDLRFHLGPDWYRAQFPLRWRTRGRGAASPRVQTGEASPYYMFHPHAPVRIREMVPDARLIVMLRNPVDRAYSHYQHEFRKKRESLSFAEAVEREPERLHGELERMLQDPRYNSRAHRRHAYVTRGVYLESLERVLQVFPREQLLVIRSEDYFGDPDATLRRVCAFLGLPAQARRTFAKRNVGAYAPIAPDLRARLAAFYAPHNARLSDLLGADVGWS